MSLSDDQTMVRNRARDLARKQLIPNATQWDREAKVPDSVPTEMGKLDLLGMCADPEWGGAGVDYLSNILAVEKTAACNTGTSTEMVVNYVPVCPALVGYATDVQNA